MRKIIKKEIRNKRIKLNNIKFINLLRKRKDWKRKMIKFRKIIKIIIIRHWKIKSWWIRIKNNNLKINTWGLIKDKGVLIFVEKLNGLKDIAYKWKLIILKQAQINGVNALNNRVK